MASFNIINKKTGAVYPTTQEKWNAMSAERKKLFTMGERIEERVARPAIRPEKPRIPLPPAVERATNNEGKDAAQKGDNE